MEDQERALAAARTISTTTNFWIGLNDIAHEGMFTWRNGRSMRFSNWADGEHNGGTAENCVEMKAGTGEWNDVGCASSKPFVCQRDVKRKYTRNLVTQLSCLRLNRFLAF